MQVRCLERGNSVSGQVWILSWVSGTYLKMTTLENFVSILLMKAKKLKENLSKYGFLTNSSS